jgi:dephospho-CoA kinase
VLVIGVVGRRGSGKGVFAEAARGLGMPVFEMSDVVVERMLETDVLITNRSLRLFADGLRKRFGKAFVARETVKSIEKETESARAVVVVGIRSPEEIDAFRRAFKDFVLVGIKAPLETRWKRVQKRKRPEDARSLKDFSWAEKIEEKWGVGRALEMADVAVKNDGEREAFKRFSQRLLTVLVETG